MLEGTEGMPAHSHGPGANTPIRAAAKPPRSAKAGRLANTRTATPGRFRTARKTVGSPPPSALTTLNSTNPPINAETSKPAIMAAMLRTGRHAFLRVPICRRPFCQGPHGRDDSAGDEPKRPDHDTPEQRTRLLGADASSVQRSRPQTRRCRNQPAHYRRAEVTTEPLAGALLPRGTDRGQTM